MKKKEIPKLRAKNLPKQIQEQLQPKQMFSGYHKGRISGKHKFILSGMGLREGDIPPHYYKYRGETFLKKVRQWIKDHPELVRKPTKKKE